MFKVLIVDEEIYVVSLIRELITWEAYGMQVIDIVNSGTRALQLVQQKKPDLIIADVWIKGCDGTSFIDQVREFDQHVRLIVISGRREFEFAQNAIKKDADNYLLKPINKNELEESLSMIERKLLKQYSEDRRRRELEQELQRSKRKIHADLLRDMLSGTLHVSNDEINRINVQYLTNFTATEFLLFSLHLESVSTSTTKEWMEPVTGWICSEIRNSCLELILYPQGNYVVGLCNINEQLEKLKSSFYWQLEKLNETAGKNQKICYSVCIGENFRDLSSIQMQYTGLLQCIHSRVALGIGKIISCKDIKFPTESMHKEITIDKDKLQYYLMDSDRKNLKLYIRELFSSAFYLTNYDSQIYYRLLTQLVFTLYRHFSETGMIHSEYRKYEKEFERHFCIAISPRQMSELFYQQLDYMLSETHFKNSTIEVPAIRAIKKYIEKHFAEEIRVTDLADLLNLNPDYISRIFKKEEKKCLLEYIHEYRIERAKEMLKDIRNNIDTVAFATGFHNTRYFYRIFKRIVGISPSDYRKREAGFFECEKEKALGTGTER